MTFPHWYTWSGTLAREESLVDRVNRVFTAGLFADCDVFAANLDGLPQFSVERIAVRRAMFANILALATAAEEKADPTYKSQHLAWTPVEAEASRDGASVKLTGITSRRGGGRAMVPTSSASTSMVPTRSIEGLR
jgi:hypothetical protein